MVDDSDYDHLITMKWYTPKNGLKYAKRSFGKKTLSMHRYILGVVDRNVLVDHIDGNPLNNTRGNLRICSSSQNLHNSKKPSRGVTSEYKGVHVTKQGGIRAQICLNSKRVHLGTFRTFEEAALAYNNAAISALGEFARLNKLENFL